MIAHWQNACKLTTTIRRLLTCQYCTLSLQTNTVFKQIHVVSPRPHFTQRSRACKLCNVTVSMVYPLQWYISKIRPHTLSVRIQSLII